jgi:hypothetical protein
VPRDDRQTQQALAQATHHRQLAGELFAQHRREGGEELLDRAKSENAKANAWEHKAMGISPRQEDSFQRDGEAAGDSQRRAWYEPGSVAEDKLMQFEEARQGGILDQVTRYAARSVFDKEHRTFDGAKQVGKAVSAPFKAARALGRSKAKDSQGQTKQPPSVLQEIKQSAKARPGRDSPKQAPEKARQRRRQPPAKSKSQKEPQR